ncbi:MAG: glycosyltransferase family 1 protein, partial [Nitrospinaceae bacterium]
AMSFENAVFTTKQNGASEILNDDFVMNDSNDFSILSKINKLLKNQAELENVKKENRLDSQQFSIEFNLSKTLKIINKFL